MPVARKVWQPILTFMPRSDERRWIVRQASTRSIAVAVSVPVGRLARNNRIATSKSFESSPNPCLRGSSAVVLASIRQVASAAPGRPTVCGGQSRLGYDSLADTKLTAHQKREAITRREAGEGGRHGTRRGAAIQVAAAE